MTQCNTAFIHIGPLSAPKISKCFLRFHSVRFHSPPTLIRPRRIASPPSIRWRTAIRVGYRGRAGEPQCTQCLCTDHLVPWLDYSLAAAWLLWCLVPRSDLVPLVAVLGVAEGSVVVLCAMVGALQWCFSCCFGWH